MPVETLRKYPPVPNLTRRAKSNYQIPGTNVTIAKGTQVIIPILGIQHDPEYYPNPEKFDPTRFCSEAVKKRHPMTWLAFGDGPRNCVALRFGMMQTRIGLVTLLKNFEFTLAARTPVPLHYLVHTFTLMPRGGIYLNIKPLNS